MCSKGHEWQAPIYSRRTSGCPICSGEMKTSFPEQAIFFYLKQITYAHNRYQIQPRVEIDIYLPKLNIGIEYDGAYFHKGELSKNRENHKRNVLFEYGISLIRIKETTSKEKKKDIENIIYCSRNPSYDELNNTIKKLLNCINIMTQSFFALDIDISRDRLRIYEQYIEGE